MSFLTHSTGLQYLMTDGVEFIFAQAYLGLMSDCRDRGQSIGDVDTVRTRKYSEGIPAFIGR